MSNTQKQRSATERLNDVEQATMSTFQTLENMTRDIMLIKDAIKLLGNKVDSIVKASMNGQPLTDEVISYLMVQNNIEELKAKVDNLIAQGILVAEAVVGAQSFIVVREVDDTGKVINPRLQLTMGALAPHVAEKLIGAQSGQVVDVEAGALKVEVLEVYAIQSLKAPETEEAAPAQAVVTDSANTEIASS